MTLLKTSSHALSTMTSEQLVDLLLAASGELASRTDHGTAELLPALESLGRCMGQVGRSIGASYARPRSHVAAVPRRTQLCTLSPVSHLGAHVNGSERLTPLTMYGIHESRPGSKWRSLFEATWDGYRTWYASEGLAERPDLSTCRAALTEHMPELMPTWERLAQLTGGDGLAARMLSLWNPPAFAPGCAQLALEAPQRILVRNYDYDPQLFERVVYSTSFADKRVIGTGDCLWGLLDGMNDDGLVVSFTYGGRPGCGPGFAIPLVVRYLLEVCSTVHDAKEVLRRVPVATAYNVTVADRSGEAVTVFVAHATAAEFFETPLATNHRGLVPEHPELARRLNSVERQDALVELVRSGADRDQVAAAFLQAPLHNTRYSRGFGTLYTAVYRPDDGVVEYRWPDAQWNRGFDSPDATFDVVLREPASP
jgi:predicted choloylglycine hydrolase